ncbi:disease resistance protein RPM1-like protein [Carex littledalei]|uniref:Disease resistance protein RPM1-like protein n=1 Tax=Carex littledalei TaxID=544730 RepID=A0A833R6I5_9POAL|nr:disease resistance protein RPM1-like protein [Carex littledalei]
MEAVDISIAKYAMNLVVQTATTAIRDEIGLLLGVQEELLFIKEDLEMMQAFLNDALIEDVKCCQMVTTWINQVQELAFDVEDCIQEASDHLMKKSCLSVMCSVKKRDRIVKKIQVLKTRMVDVSKRNQQYNLISKRNNGGPTYNENEGASTRLIANVEDLLVGLDEPQKELVELILKEHVELRDDEPWKGKVISVVGTGGLGKTTLVRKVYGCQQLKDCEFKCFAWVTVLHPFNTEEFIESLAKQIPSDAQEQLPNRSIIEMVTNYLKDNKYLIVLDDLSSLSEWEKIKDILLPTGNESRIIVTTQSRLLAEFISHPSDNIYQIKELSKNDAFDLFCKVVQKQGITIDMMTQAGLIIESCGRLPLAIINIGSYLATKPKTNAEWKTMHDHLSLRLLNKPELAVGKTVLSFSYDGMPDHLKSCLLYLSVFHNHKEIRRSRIIRRWMADGYVMQDQDKMAKEIGKGYFYDLMGRSLIQPSQMSTIIVNGDVKRCEIHDMMYQLILSKAIDLNIVSLLKDENLITKRDKARHLVITGGPCKWDKGVLANVNLSHIRSVSIFGKVGDYLRYDHKMKLVRVLDLEGTSDLNNRELRSVGKLRHLKYLGLRGTKITKLPDSLGKLSELETLDIRNTAVVRLPIGFTKLLKLSYLRAGFDLYNNPPHIEQITGINKMMMRGSFGVRAPRGIGELRSLNILGMIDIGRSKGLAKEIQNLANLRKLALSGFTKKNGKTLAKVIDGLKHLRSLLLRAADDSGLSCCLESVSSPPEYLKSLKLYSSLGELPVWISSLENVKKIHFSYTNLTQDIKAIEKLPNLKILYLLGASFKDVNELRFGEGTFPMLQVLILEEWIKSVSIEKKALKRLEQLKIRKCSSVGVVSGLEFLVQLKEMEVVVSESESDKMFVSNMQEQLSLLPEIPELRVIKR